MPGIWSRRQRGAVLGIVTALLCYLAIQYSRNPVEIGDPPPADGARADELADRVDPNTADAAALAAIPMLGEKRAAEVVAYREDFLKDHPGEIAFAKASDLIKVKGIGPATIKTMEPYLVFPGTRATTGE